VSLGEVLGDKSELILRVFVYTVTIAFGYILNCGCLLVTCFVMCGCVYVWVFVMYGCACLWVL
jgi:hypothetical protein